MNSLETTTDSYHLPQHAQLSHDRLFGRTLADLATSFSCAPPSPQIKSYFNPLTNETQYIKTDAKIHEIGILFNYEIRHASDVAWEAVPGESEEENKGFFGKAGDYFSGLFGRGDEDEGGEGGSESEGGENLLDIEKLMVSEVWKSLLENEKMTWDWEEKCAGLVIEDDEPMGQRRQLSNETVLVDEKVDGAVGPEDEVGGAMGLGDEVDGAIYMEYESNNATALMEGEVNDVAELEDEGDNATVIIEDDRGEDTLGTADTKLETFSGTKLLGMTYQPEDYVNDDGCVIPDSTCTAIRGSVSVAYSGINEYGVIQTVIEQLRTGMDSGAFLPPGSPALNLEFQSAGGTAPSVGTGQIIPRTTDRGTDTPEVEEEGDLSEYGTLFVCLVGILGAGFIVAMYVRYRKRKRRKAKEATNDGVEFTEDDYEANLAMRHGPTYESDEDPSEIGPDSCGVPACDSLAKRPARALFGHGKPAHTSPARVIQVELDVPQAGSGDGSGEVEVCWSGSNSF